MTEATSNTTRESQVVINGQPLDEERLRALETLYGRSVPDGRYWYDAACGAWGLEGGPTIGLMIPGLDLPGPMPENISGGRTGTWINGREIHPDDRAAFMAAFGMCWSGRFQLDAMGNLGPEGGPMITNLVVAARQVQANSGGGSGGGLISTKFGTVSPDGGFFSRNVGGGYTSYPG